MLKVPFKDVWLLMRHLLVADGAHVVIIAVIDVGPILILETLLQCLPSRLRCVLTSHILGASRLVEDASLPFDTKVLAQLREPFQN